MPRPARSGDRASTVGRVLRRLRDAAVVVQVAAALVLVAGATLLARSFGELVDVPLGVDVQGVLTYQVHLPSARYAETADRDVVHTALHARVAALPEVLAVGATSWLPVNGRYHTWSFQWAATPQEDWTDDDWRQTDVRTIAGDYFGALGIDLLRGQSWEDIDFEAEQVAWVNRRLAEEVFGDANPLDQTIRLAGQYRRVAGVVEDIPYGPREEISLKAYVPHVQADSRNWALIQTVRVRGDLVAARERIRDELRALDPQLVLYRPKTLEGVISTARAQDRFATVLMSAFALLTLVLSLVGTYGVLAGSVSARTREIGIRMALGADAHTVRRMVIRYAAALTVPGVLLGLLGAWIGSRWLETLLFGLEAADPLTYVMTVAVFVAVGLFSGWLPATRATRVDTVQTLSAE